MNSGPTAERVYETLKQMIMGRGFRPGERLDPTVLSDTLNSSTTPVREALDRLVGEELVESRTGSGFHLPAVDEPGLKDMYGWSAELLTLSLKRWSRSAAGPAALMVETAVGEAQRLLAMRGAAVFAAIARRSLNSEHIRAVERINARLHAARVVEPLLIDDAGDELDRLEAAARAGDRRALARSIAAYHRRRIRLSARIVRALYRAD